MMDNVKAQRAQCTSDLQLMRFPIETEFRAIDHSEYGAPERVLRIAKRQLKSEELGVDDVLVKVIAWVSRSRDSIRTIVSALARPTLN